MHKLPTWLQVVGTLGYAYEKREPSYANLCFALGLRLIQSVLLLLWLRIFAHGQGCSSQYRSQKGCSQIPQKLAQSCSFFVQEKRSRVIKCIRKEHSNNFSSCSDCLSRWPLNRLSYSSQELWAVVKVHSVVAPWFLLELDIFKECDTKLIIEVRKANRIVKLFGVVRGII